jgi:adenylate cyclase class IV
MMRSESERALTSEQAHHYDGLTVRCTVEKHREVFTPRFSPMSITLDTVTGLGSFLEIEGPSEHAVRQWVGQLLVPEMLWEQRSYETMMRQQNAERAA